MTSKHADDLTPPAAQDEEGRRQLFDRWAGSYDANVAASKAFPFAGYDGVLDRIVERASPRPGMTVLDLGTGTGALAARFVAAGCEVIGLDFSLAMLDSARAKVPGATFVQASLTDERLPDLGRTFDLVVSAYTFHELSPAQRCALIGRLFATQLGRHGALLIGDISFPAAAERERVRRDVGPGWDEREFYLVADEERDALERLGLRVEYEPISFCGGVFALRRQDQGTELDVPGPATG
jgi:putative AdoMet-dependent methyltransferase